MASKDGALTVTLPSDREILMTRIFDAPRELPPEMEGVYSWEGTGREWTAIHALDAGRFAESASRCGATVVADRPPTLDEIFVGRVGGHPS